MNYFGSASTDVGIVKKTNQDSVCVKIADIDGFGQIAMAVICDGMGGLAKGELASATVIRRFSDWFENQLPKFLKDYSWQKLADVWTKIVREQNYKILDYGKIIQVNLGTTLAAILIIDGSYMVINVGDSRVYEISNSVKQLTEDQTFVNREIKEGRMTPQEASVHPKRNMLLQCVGASAEVNPEIIFGKIEPNTVYMLCSDGFRHVLTENEMLEKFNPDSINSIDEMEKNSRNLIELIKKRNERDNITVALLKSIL